VRTDFVAKKEPSVSSTQTNPAGTTITTPTPPAVPIIQLSGTNNQVALITPAPAVAITQPTAPAVAITQPMATTLTSDKIDLYILSRILPIHQEKDPECDSKSGCFLMISRYSEAGSTDMPRGDIGNKWPASVFNNQITLKYRFWNKNINLKIFSNGKLQMTGIKDPATEPQHMGQAIIDRLKTLKYRVFTTRKALNNATISGQYRLDYALIWQPDTLAFKPGELTHSTTTPAAGDAPTLQPPIKTNIDWLRRNLDVYDIRRIMAQGMTYDSTATRWYSSTEAGLLIREYVLFADQKAIELDALRYVLLNQYEFPIPARLEYHRLLGQYRQLVKICDKQWLAISETDYKKTITKLVEKITKIFKAYKTTMVKLFEFDCRFRDDVAGKYSQTFADELVKAKAAGTLLAQQEFATPLSSREYKVDNIAIELINSDYNTRMNNNLPEIYRILTTNYKLYCKYKPNEKYAGIIVKFKYNPAYLDETKYKPGRCYCAGSCSNKKNPQCTKLTVSIFRPGSIIITAAKTIDQLMYVYGYINRILRDNYKVVFYRDVSGNQRDHYRANEDRKIVRKDNIIYVRASDVIYPAGRQPINAPVQ
jgi:TATA-box binding protein (TBP) (component of TFIID and TFIIIB)